MIWRCLHQFVRSAAGWVVRRRPLTHLGVGALFLSWRALSLERMTVLSRARGALKRQCSAYVKAVCLRAVGAWPLNECPEECFVATVRIGVSLLINRDGVA